MSDITYQTKSIIKFAERRDVPSFCMIKIILALAFADGAFASPHISKAEDIYNIKIPDRLEPVLIEWAPEWKYVPVLRRSVRDTKRTIRTSPSEASPYSQMLFWN